MKTNMQPDLTLTTVNWNQKSAIELMLKSYVKHHYNGSPLHILLVDSGSNDGSKEWLRENEIPFLDLPENIGHEIALNVIYPDIKTKYALLCDSDIEFLDNVYCYLDYMQGKCVSVGELVENAILNGKKLKPRIGPWFWLFDYQLMRQTGVHTWRDTKDWTYDTGSWFWEQMHSRGYTNHNLIRKPFIRGSGIGYQYEKFNHFGSVSWDLRLLPEHATEINLRRNCIDTKLNSYQDIDLRGKFIC